MNGRSTTPRAAPTIAAATVGAALCLGAAACLTMAPATGGAVHGIRTATSPSTGLPVAGGGSWIVNKPSGYYVGRAMPGSTFDDEVTTGAGTSAEPSTGSTPAGG